MPGPVRGDVDLAIADVYRAEWGRLLSILVARNRRLDLAEDALSEAFARASDRWPVVGVLTARLDDVCRTIYLAFTAGYTPGDGPDLLRTDRAGGPIELAVVLRSLVPAAPQVQALADRLPESWELLPHAVAQYFIAPDLIVSNLYGHVNTWRFVPGGPGATEVVHTLYTRGEVVDPDERESYHRRFESARAVTGVEDYPESERVHGNLDSGRVEHTLIGRNEAGVHLFHDAVERALVR